MGFNGVAATHRSDRRIAGRTLAWTTCRSSRWTLVRGHLAVAYRRWKGTEPTLAAFDGPERLLAFLWNEEAPAEVQDRALGALLRLARTEPLASRFICRRFCRA